MREEEIIREKKIWTKIKGANKKYKDDQTEKKFKKYEFTKGEIRRITYQTSIEISRDQISK